MITTALCEQPVLLQLSENIGNPWGELTPTLNYRLALTASLFPHQPANPASHQPSPALTKLSLAPSSQSPANLYLKTALCSVCARGSSVCLLQP